MIKDNVYNRITKLRSLMMLLLLLISILISGCYKQMVTSNPTGSSTSSSALLQADQQDSTDKSGNDDILDISLDDVSEDLVSDDLQNNEPQETEGISHEDVTATEISADEDLEHQEDSIASTSDSDMVDIDNDQSGSDQSSGPEVNELEAANNNLETPSQEGTQAVGEADRVYQVSLSIIGLEGHVILDTAVIESNEISVFELLKNYCDDMDIPLDYTGAFEMAYIKGINNLYEFDYGPLSGWMYAVDGVFPTKSVGSYQLDSDKEVVFYYTLDSGKDIGALGE